MDPQHGSYITVPLYEQITGPSNATSYMQCDLAF